MTQEAQCVDLAQEVERELAEESRTESWKVRMRAAYASGDVEPIVCLLRPVTWGWIRVIHRSERCDLSLFQLGLRMLEHVLNEDLSIPVAFYIVI